MDYIVGNNYDDLVIGQLNNNLGINFAETLERVTEKYQLPSDVAVPYVLAGGTEDSVVAREIAEDIAFNRAKSTGQIWTEMQQKYQYESLEDNMKMSVWDLLSLGYAPGGAKPGDVQYGVWAMAGLDAFFQTYGPSGKWSILGNVPGLQVGRSQAYLRDLRRYDKLLQKGYTPRDAQEKLQIDVSITEVGDIGKDTNLVGDIRKHIDMIREANRMGGEPVLWNMMRQVLNGKPVNFDRGTKITLESVKAENTPYYLELINNYGYTPDEARKFIYDKIGSPVKNFDENGEINYTSSFRPNQVNFYAGRKNQRFMFMGDNLNQDVYREDYAKDKDYLIEYSPGKVQTAEIFEPGTRAFDIMSGTIDAGYQLVPELVAGKGLKGISNLRKGFTRINQAFELTQEVGKSKKTGKLINISPRKFAKQLADEVADEADPFIGTGNFDKFTNPKTGKAKLADDITPVYKDIKAATKKIKKEHTFFGTVPRFFQLTKKEILEQPIMVDYFKAIAATTPDDLALLSTNPIISKMHPHVIKEMTIETDWKKIQKMHSDMMDTGYSIVDDAGIENLYKLEQSFAGGQLPVKGSFVLNKLLQQTAVKGTQLQQKGGVYGKAVGGVLKSLGNEQAAYRSAGSYLGEKVRNVRIAADETLGMIPLVGNLSRSRKARNLIEVDDTEIGILDDLDSIGENIPKQKIVDELGGPVLDVEKYLGFSSNFNSTYNPYYRKLLGFIPDQGIPLNNLNTGYRQLVSHLQINEYSNKQMSNILQEFLDVDFNDKQAIRKFTTEQAERDIALVHARGGSWKYVADAAEKMYEGLSKSKIYALGKNKNILPNVGTGYETYRIRTPDGAYVDMPMMTGSMFSEMADNVAPLLDYRILNRAMGRMFKHYEQDKEIVSVFTRNIQDAKQFGKYKMQQLLGKDNISVVNPYDDGVISAKKLEDDMVSNLATFYTRNVFKPFVLLRAAFFTRVFLEEQARIATAGLSGLYNHPFKYIQWLASHNPNSKLAKLPFVKGAEYNEDGVQLLQSLEAMEASYNTFKPTDLIGPGSRNKKYTEYLAKTKDELDTKKYSKSLFFELIMLRNDPIARKVAEFGYGSAELKAWIKSSAGRNARQELFNYGGTKWQEILLDGDFLDQHLQYLESRIRTKSGGSIIRGKDLIKQSDGTYRYALKSSDLGDLQIRQAIGTGKFETKKGEVLDFYENADKTLAKFKMQPVMDELISLVESGLDAGAVKVTRNVVDDADKGTLQSIEDVLDNAYQILFDNLMTKPIGYLNRSPVFVQYRWNYITGNFTKYSPALQRKFIKEAKEAAVPKQIQQELKGLAALKSGSINDYQAINTESKAFGLAMVKNLLYDTKQKHALSDKLLNIFPFAEVWFEVFQTWGQLLAANPTVLRKGYVGLRGGTAADSFGSSSDDGFFVPDPRNPEDSMFVQPFGGQLTSIIFGEDSNTKISPRGYLEGVNLLGQGFVPGPNPLVGYALNKVLPEYGQPFEWLRETIYGDFPPPEKVSDAFEVSPVYKKLLAGGLSPESFENITEDSREIHKMRASATNDVYRYGMASGQNNKLYKDGSLNVYLNKLYPNGWTPDTVTQKQIDLAFMEYAKIKSGHLFFMQFVYQFFGPTGFKPEFFIEDDNGNLWGQAVLYDEYVRIKEKNEGNDIATYNEFFELYGIEHPWLLSPKSQSETGKQPSSVRVQKFQAENKEVFDQLKISGYYLNMDNPNEEKDYSDIVKEKSLLSPDQYQRGVNDTLGFFRYKNFTSNLEKLDIPYKQKTIIKRMYREQLKEALPGFQADEYGLITPPSTKDVFNEMRDKWRNIPFVMEQEAGKGFAEIMPYWEEMEKISLENGTDTWWLTSNDTTALAMRIWMYNKAQQIIAEYPEFWGVWNGVMLKLYRDDFEVLDYMP
jgi:hypothetical protein